MCIKVYMLILVLSKFIQTEVTVLNRMYTLCHCAMKIVLFLKLCNHFKDES